LKALEIRDDFDEADGVLYFMAAVGLKDKKASCSALIKSMERGEFDSADYYDANNCSEIPGFPSYDDFIKNPDYYMNVLKDTTIKNDTSVTINTSNILAHAQCHARSWLDLCGTGSL
jgi:hypothetical protein